MKEPRMMGLRREPRAGLCDLRFLSDSVLIRIRDRSKAGLALISILPLSGTALRMVTLRSTPSTSCPKYGTQVPIPCDLFFCQGSLFTIPKALSSRGGKRGGTLRIVFVACFVSGYCVRVAVVPISRVTGLAIVVCFHLALACATPGGFHERVCVSAP